MSPQSLRANSSVSTPPKLSEYIFAKDCSVKHQPMSVQAKRTFPFSGLSRFSSAPPGSASAMTVFTSSMVCFSLK